MLSWTLISSENLFLFFFLKNLVYFLPNLLDNWHHNVCDLSYFYITVSVSQGNFILGVVAYYLHKINPTYKIRHPGIICLGKLNIKLKNIKYFYSVSNTHFIHFSGHLLPFHVRRKAICKKEKKYRNKFTQNWEHYYYSLYYVYFFNWRYYKHYILYQI